MKNANNEYPKDFQEILNKINAEINAENAKEIAEAQNLVNKWIQQDLVVTCEEMEKMKIEKDVQVIKDIIDNMKLDY